MSVTQDRTLAAAGLIFVYASVIGFTDNYVQVIAENAGLWQFHVTRTLMAMVLLGLVALLSIVADFVATAAGAKRVGAGPMAVWGAALGTLAGLFFGPIGLLAGPFLGALLGELWHTRALRRATHVGLATWVGLLLGTVLKLALAFAMLGLFVLAWWL